METSKNISPDISIITVCLNSGDTIQKCISSVKAQNIVTIEHLIIDGGSTDDTLSIIGNNPSVSLNIYNGSSIYEAMNRGLKLAKGRVIAFLNSDDYYSDNNVISDILSRLKENNADVVCGGIIYTSNTYKNNRLWIPKEFTLNSYLNGYHTPHPGFFATKSIYDRFGNYNIKYKISADYDLMMRIMENSDVKTIIHPKIVVIMRNDGISSKFTNRIKALFENIKIIREKFNNVNLLKFLILRYLSKLKYLF